MLSADKEWYKREGASSEILATLKSVSNIHLSDKYLQLLEYSNGGEGPLAVQPYNFCLDPAELVAKNIEGQNFADSFPGFLVFGGNGGGELIAFDVRDSEPWPVVSLDMTNIDIEESVELVAESFDLFLEIIGIESSDA